jgi:bifunctional enzyme CysN/CysC
VKTKLAFNLEQILLDKGYQTYVFDSDNIRFGLSSDLGFTHKDRTENIRRICEVALLFAQAGFNAISTFISPYREDRSLARKKDGAGFREVFLSAGPEACDTQDPKGLCAKARNGEIVDFTGVTAPYEEPVNPEIELNTGVHCLTDSVDVLRNYITEKFNTRK